MNARIRFADPIRHAGLMRAAPLRYVDSFWAGAMPGRQHLPKPILCGTSRGRSWYARRAQRAFADPRRFDPVLAQFLDALILPELWSAVDFDGDGAPDALAFAFTNAGVAQRLVGVRAALDGRRQDAEQIRVDNGFLVCRAAAISRIRFEPGVPLVVTLLGVSVGAGVHFLDLRLRGEIEDILLVGMPIIVDREGVRPAWHRSPAEPDLTLRTPPISMIPHAHFDLAGDLGESDATQAAMGILQDALRVAKERPEFTFTFAHAAPIEELAARRPDMFGELRAMVAAGRFEPVCAGMAATAPQILHGELFTRHVIRWQRFARERFGRESRTGWWTHAGALGPQTPQILLKAGISALVAAEPALGAQSPPYFWWRGLDEARIATLNLADGAGGAYPAHADIARTMRRWFALVERLAGRFGKSPIALPSGGRLAAPRIETADALTEWNRLQPNAPMRFATPGPLLAALDRDKLPTLGPLVKKIKRGVIAAKTLSPPLWTVSRRAVNAIGDLETLHAITKTDADTDVRMRREIERLWDEALRSTSTAALAGAVGPKPCEEIARRFEHIERDAAEHTRALLAGIFAGKGPRAARRIAVANTLGFARQEAVEVWLEAENGALPVVHDTRRILPTQILERELFPDGTIKRARVALLVHVPACAVRVYDLATSDAGLEGPPRRYFARAADDVVENGFVRAELDPRRATVRSLWDRKHDANVGFADAGQFVWSADGAPAWAWWLKKSFVVEDIDVLENGPVRAAVRYGGHVGGQRMSVTYRLTQGSRHVEVSVDGAGGINGGSARAVFATEFRRGTFNVEVPYGRIDGCGAPAQGFVSLASGGREVVFLGDGSPRWTHRRGRVTLDIDARREGDVTPLRYGLLLHVGPAERDHAAKRVQAFARPMPVIGPVLAPDGGPTGCVVRVEPANVVMTALRKDGDGLELRVYESAGEGGMMRLVFASPPRSVTVTDLLGRPAKTYPVEGRTATLPIGPFEIKTVRIGKDEG